MKIGIIGLGLIGGSMGKDLCSQLMVEVAGYDQDETHASRAEELGLVQSVMDYESIVKWADVIILSIPISPMIELLVDVLNKLSDNQTVIDLGSTKASLGEAVSAHPKRGRYVASHPLAGTEFSGPDAAIGGLYRDKKNIICDAELSDQDALEAALAILKSVGLVTTFMKSREHDMHMAYVSHLSHVTSFTLGLTVLDIEQDEKQIFNLASTGFASTARLAKSSPVTWSAIFEHNNGHLVTAIDSYIVWLKKFREAIAQKDIEAMEAYMHQANEMKRILK